MRCGISLAQNHDRATAFVQCGTDVPPSLERIGKWVRPGVRPTRGRRRCETTHRRSGCARRRPRRAAKIGSNRPKRRVRAMRIGRFRWPRAEPAVRSKAGLTRPILRNGMCHFFWRDSRNSTKPRMRPRTSFSSSPATLKRSPQTGIAESPWPATASRPSIFFSTARKGN